MGNGVRACAVAVSMLLVALAVGQPGPAGAQSARAGEPAADGCGAASVAGDQQAALGLAVRCGVPVEIESARGPGVRQVAEPDGTITLTTTS